MLKEYYQIPREGSHEAGFSQEIGAGEKKNVRHSLARLHGSEMLSGLRNEGKVEFAVAIYHIETGTVECLKD